MKRKKKHAPLQGSVRGYIREISVAMFLQIQTDIHAIQPKLHFQFDNLSSLFNNECWWLYY